MTTEDDKDSGSGEEATFVSAQFGRKRAERNADRARRTLRPTVASAEEIDPEAIIARLAGVSEPTANVAEPAAPAAPSPVPQPQPQPTTGLGLVPAGGSGPGPGSSAVSLVPPPAAEVPAPLVLADPQARSASARPTTPAPAGSPLPTAGSADPAGTRVPLALNLPPAVVARMRLRRATERVDYFEQLREAVEHKVGDVAPQAEFTKKRGSGPWEQVTIQVPESFRAQIGDLAEAHRMNRSEFATRLLDLHLPKR